MRSNQAARLVAEPLDFFDHLKRVGALGRAHRDENVFILLVERRDFGASRFLLGDDAEGIGVDRFIREIDIVNAVFTGEHLREIFLFFGAQFVHALFLLPFIKLRCHYRHCSARCWYTRGVKERGPDMTRREMLKKAMARGLVASALGTEASADEKTPDPLEYIEPHRPLSVAPRPPRSERPPSIEPSTKPDRPPRSVPGQSGDNYIEPQSKDGGSMEQ